MSSPPGPERSKRAQLKSDYETTIDRAFYRCCEKAQLIRIRHLQETKARQAKRGFIGKSSGDAQLLGKAINAGCASLAKDLICELDRIMAIGGNDVPSDAADQLSERFLKQVDFLGGLALRAAEDYLGGDHGLDALPLARIRADWSTLRADLAQKFSLLVRKYRVLQTAREKKAPPRVLNSQVGPVHFEDHSGLQFERLVFAFALRNGWPDIRWLGEAGGDGGRDIWCTAEDKTATAVLCANYRRLSFRKAASDLKKLTRLGTRPDKILVVTGGKVSAALRERLESEAVRLGFEGCPIWAGSEFEERVRHKAESLLKRFCEGVEFPDAPVELAVFSAEGGGAETGIHAPPVLSADAKRLLHAMAEAEDGNLLRVQTMDGYSLTANQREFLSDTKARRVIAQWERAIDQLLDFDLIKAKGSSGELFVITADGYDAICEGGSVI